MCFCHAARRFNGCQQVRQEQMTERSDAFQDPLGLTSPTKSRSLGPRLTPIGPPRQTNLPSDWHAGVDVGVITAPPQTDAVKINTVKSSHVPVGVNTAETNSRRRCLSLRARQQQRDVKLETSAAAQRTQTGMEAVSQVSHQQSNLSLATVGKTRTRKQSVRGDGMSEKTSSSLLPLQLKLDSTITV